MDNNKENTTVPNHNEQFRPGSDPGGSGRNHIFTKNMVLRRKQLHYTQQDLSDLTEIKLRTIQNYEKGQQPKGYTAVDIAEALECSLDWLLTGKGPEPPDPGEKKQAAEPSPYNKVEAGPPLVEEPKPHYEAGREEGFKVSDALTMAARVLESGTSYATALFLNIQHFDMALRSGARISALEHKQNNLYTEINLIKKHLADITQENSDLRKRLQEKERQDKEDANGDIKDTGIAIKAAGNKS